MGVGNLLEGLWQEKVLDREERLEILLLRKKESKQMARGKTARENKSRAKTAKRKMANSRRT